MTNWAEDNPSGPECECVIAQQWNLTEKQIHLLQPLAEATREASGDYAPAAVVVPVVNPLKQFLTSTAESTYGHGIMHMKKEMPWLLNCGYQNMETK